MELWPFFDSHSSYSFFSTGKASARFASGGSVSGDGEAGLPRLGLANVN